MITILKDFSPHVCAQANLENLCGFWRFLGKSSLCTVDESEGLFLFHAGLTKDQIPMAAQGVCKTDLSPENVDQKIEYVVDFFNSRNMPFWWYVCPSSKPGNLDDYLKAHSFNEMDGTPVMAVELHNLIDDRPKPVDFEIKEAKDETSIRQLWDVWYQGYPMPEIVGKLNADACVDIGYHPDNPLKFYVGYLGGKPVASSFIMLAGGVVGLYGVVVLPEARGRGIGTEMSLHPLRVARSMGFHIGVLDATQQGIGIYRRIGFKEVCKPKIYTYADPDNVALEESLKGFMHSKRE